MNTKLKLIPLLVANLFAVTAVSAADDEFTWSGTVEAGARGISSDGDTRNGARSGGIPPTPANTVPFEGPRDNAKFIEYRDLKHDGLIGDFDIRGNNNRYYVNLFGENIARDDMYLNAQGGQYGVFKYRLYDDKMVHNFSSNALTPFVGVGSNTLTVPTG